MKLAFARGELLAALPELDSDHDKHLSQAEIDAARRALEQGILGKIEVTGAGERCQARMGNAALTEQDGVNIEGTFTCKSGLPRFDVSLPLLADLPRGHRHLAHAAGKTTSDEILYGDHTRFSVVPGAAGEAKPPAEGKRLGFLGFLGMGVEHILTGYDHLVFLFGLVLLRGRIRSVLAVVTAFTVAHSITLGLSVLDVWAPRPSFVEPAIALSIAYVGVENFFVRTCEGRWRITFPFGLIHGFGFAGALREIELPRDRVPVALVSFNLGVELGQLAVLAVVLPLLFVLRHEAVRYEERGVRVLSAAVALAGLVWFVARITT